MRKTKINQTALQRKYYCDRNAAYSQLFPWEIHHTSTFLPYCTSLQSKFKLPHVFGLLLCVLIRVTIEVQDQTRNHCDRDSVKRIIISEPVSVISEAVFESGNVRVG